MEAVNNNKNKRPLDLDWDKLLPNEEEPPHDLVVTKKSKRYMEDEQQQNDDLIFKSDHELNELIARARKNIQEIGPKLPDKGGKLKATLKRCEDEVERRKIQRPDKDDNGCEDSTQLRNPSVDGASCGIKRGASTYLPQSKFGRWFVSKMDESHKDSRTVNAFEEDLSYMNPCQQQRIKSNGQCTGRGRQKNGLSSRQKPFQSPSTVSVDVEKQTISHGDKKGSHSTTCTLRLLDEDMPGCFSKRITSQDQPSRKLRPRNGQTVVLVDEEEPQLQKTMQQAEKLDDCMKAITIYYPSRDDPESVEISYTDMECLAPQGYLSSTIMNFYIRYLQQLASPSERARCNYHFFNTYFYKKLKEAVVSKVSDREALFVKFRRWWKGVNIFEKAYILLPVHENQHWSLVIICIPAKEDESGPILLHLDSLGLHLSKSIFDNIKSFLKEEWRYLGNGEAPLDLPFTDKIWQNLDRRMDEKIITVPQQRNEYDCGIFVLFFMERFIEEAPERLKKKDLSMFSKQWFDPEEASGLRRKIRRLLVKEFEEKNAVDP